MLKFLQSLALEFPHFCRQVFPGNFGWQGKISFTEKCIENFEKVVLAQVTPPKFLSRNLRSEDLVYNSYIFFSEQPFYGNYSTLDSAHIIQTLYNFSRSCLPVKMASINVIRSISIVPFAFLACGRCKLRSEVYAQAIRLLIDLYL